MTEELLNKANELQGKIQQLEDCLSGLEEMKESIELKGGTTAYLSIDIGTHDSVHAVVPKSDAKLVLDSFHTIIARMLPELKEEFEKI